MKNDLEQVKHATDNFHWRYFYNTVAKRIGCLYNNRYLSDLTIIINDSNNNNVRFYAHKLVLATASTTFQNIFYGNAECVSIENNFELKNGRKTELHLKDVKPNVFRPFFKYIYTDKILITLDNYCDLLHISHKYDVIALQKVIHDFLKNNITISSVCNVINVIAPLKNYQHMILTDCLNFVSKYMDKIGTTEGFLSLKMLSLKEILQLNCMNVSSEYQLFKYVMKWAKYQCERSNLPSTGDNKRKVLGDNLYLIRFPVMTIDEYKRCIQEENGLLSSEEILNISGHKHVIEKDIIYLPFLTKKRLPYIDVIKSITITRSNFIKRGDHNCICGKSFTTVRGLAIHKGQYCRLKIDNQSVDIKKRRNTNVWTKNPFKSANLKNSTNLLTDNKHNGIRIYKKRSINSTDSIDSINLPLNNQQKDIGNRFDSRRCLSE